MPQMPLLHLLDISSVFSCCHQRKVHWCMTTIPVFKEWGRRGALSGYCLWTVACFDLVEKQSSFKKGVGRGGEGVGRGVEKRGFFCSVSLSFLYWKKSVMPTFWGMFLFLFFCWLFFWSERVLDIVLKKILDFRSVLNKTWSFLFETETENWGAIESLLDTEEKKVANNFFDELTFFFLNNRTVVFITVVLRHNKTVVLITVVLHVIE